jgi:hypothetical protein
MKGRINKLFIIGNGFDLAHGLETSYKHFINDFWEKEKTKVLDKNNYLSNKNDNSFIYEDNYLTIRTPKRISELPDDYNSQSAKGYHWFKCLTSANASSKHTFVGSSSSKVNISIKNKFLQIISEKDLQYWVDIEEEYYNLLKECLRLEINKPIKNAFHVNELNDYFVEIRGILESYLSLNSGNRIGKISQILNKLQLIIWPESLTNQDKINDKDIILFLNFNYTDTEKEYIDYFRTQIPQEIRCIHIHGEINNPYNPIIFGYGDELDEEYIKIENKNDKRYLENIKTIKYLQTPNYRNLFNFLESCNYDVFIMGHSCGISDRTLLNTIFENKNCHSIKIFYHKRDDGTDDHNDKIMNISRNFKDKPSMREKVIDKTNCEPLI